MLQKTRGIVIHYIKYRESSIIVKIYTEELGLQTYIVNGVRSPRSKRNVALYQPLTLLNLVVYHRSDRQQIQRISEIKCAHPFSSIPFDFKKTSITMFITEVLSKTLKEEDANPHLFHFLFDSIKYLDLCEHQYEDFHLFFLIKLCRYLGFELQSADDLFTQIEEHKKLLVDFAWLENLKRAINQLIQGNYTHKVPLDARLRAEIIDFLLLFYQLHIENFQQIKSLSVLREMNH